MKWQGWPRVRLHPGDLDGVKLDDPSTPSTDTGSGREVDAIAPLIISASRSTDIPAFFGDWFMERLRRGYAKWINPWNGTPMYVSFRNARVLVFWSKNPETFLSRLPEIERMGYGYYFLFTLNDYEAEGLEPRVPPLEERIGTFRALSGIAGKGRVAWRWDPLLLSGSLDVPALLDRIRRVGDAVAPFTERMIISFIDIAKYPRVARNLKRQGFGKVREFTPAEEEDLALGLRDMNRSWDLDLSACGEKKDFFRFGIGAGRCISHEVLLREFGSDPVLRGFLGGPDQGGGPVPRAALPVPPHLKDPGQRSSCGCVVSKDIGQYGTCPHLCAYCYANASPGSVEKRYNKYRIRAGQGTFGESITEEDWVRESPGR